ncbi:MAG: VacJ family lipoprotein [Desulfobacter sp.]|nr:MAG: VacJ family lipoprotein [Desulfobacter sp.]
MKKTIVFILVVLVSAGGLGISFAATAQAGEPSAVSSTGADDGEFSEDIFDEYEQAGEEGQAVADPIYYFNKAMFTFNDYLYFYGLKPVAQGYKAVVPTPARTGIQNFFNNLLFPVRFVNDILQGKGEAAATEFSAFFVNSTLGILGFNDFAQKHMGLKLQDEDLGQTLGAWNVGEGFYLVLPVLGPSTLRDTVGSVGDMFITPVTYVKPWELEWGMRGVDTVNGTSFRIGDYEALKDAALDPYIALRNAYIQNRRAKIQD